MAIVDGKRLLGVTFYKTKGRKEWVAFRVVWDPEPGFQAYMEIIGTVVQVDTGDDPRTRQFHYCSPIAQPVFLAASVVRRYPSRVNYTPSSWRAMPGGWRAAFRDYFGLPEPSDGR